MNLQSQTKKNETQLKTMTQWFQQSYYIYIIYLIGII